MIRSLSQKIKQIRYMQFNSSWARKVLGCYYKENRIYTIPFGLLRGFKIRYSSIINFHAMLGFWELENFEVLRKLIKAGLLKENPVCCDVGSNLGLYCLFLSKMLNDKTLIYAFEPAPDIAERLRDNLALNQIKNVKVMESACSNKTGQSNFYIGQHHHKSSLHREWAGSGKIVPEAIQVRTVTLDEFFFEEAEKRPDLIKIDIEGGGTLALKGCSRCIESTRPLILIESHTPEEDRAISELILQHNYEAFRINDRTWVRFKNRVYPEKEGVWGILLLSPSEKCKDISKVI